ncbi:MAG TPA: hypothetical protein PLX02_14680 [Syntrophorhabdaceae bacterium]|nr:hypothetical protein [Syntrophorhabdaceae bacterium]HQM82852.1 hypothetical protein [Syntrophorhabdaceae bacterium]
MTNLRVQRIYDMNLPGPMSGFAIIMEDWFGNHYQATFITRHKYADQVKKIFRRLKPLNITRHGDLGKLFTTA